MRALRPQPQQQVATRHRLALHFATMTWWRFTKPNGVWHRGLICQGDFEAKLLQKYGPQFPHTPYDGYQIVGVNDDEADSLVAALNPSNRWMWVLLFNYRQGDVQNYELEEAYPCEPDETVVFNSRTRGHKFPFVPFVTNTGVYELIG